MKWILLVLTLIVHHSVMGQNLYSDSISVNFFLLDECVITINMSPDINRIAKEYNQAPFSFQGYFPNRASTPANRKKFVEKYEISFPTKSDYFKKQSVKLEAAVCPQVVVYDEKREKILYNGRINDLYEAVGNKRRKASSEDLEMALDQILANKPISTPRTRPVGCLINFKE